MEDIPRQIELVEQLLETAPASIRPDAKVFLNVMRRVENDPTVRDNPKIRRVVENVNRVVAQGRDTYKSNRTPGI